MRQILLNGKLLYLFKHLRKDMHIGELARQLEITQNYLVTVITLLEKKKFVKKHKEGQKVFVSLTDKAMEIRPEVCRFIDTLETIHSWRLSKSEQLTS